MVLAESCRASHDSFRELGLGYCGHLAEVFFLVFSVIICIHGFIVLNMEVTGEFVHGELSVLTDIFRIIMIDREFHECSLEQHCKFLCCHTSIDIYIDWLCTNRYLPSAAR